MEEYEEEREDRTGLVHKLKPAYKAPDIASLKRRTRTQNQNTKLERKTFPLSTPCEIVQ